MTSGGSKSVGGGWPRDCAIEKVSHKKLCPYMAIHEITVSNVGASGVVSIRLNANACRACELNASSNEE